MTASQSRSAAAVLSESAMSPTTWSRTSTPICAALVCRRSGFRTRNLTWCPPSWTAFAVHAPTNPVPPVTRTFIRPPQYENPSAKTRRETSSRHSRSGQPGCAPCRATSRPASSPRRVADDDRNRPVRPGLVVLVRRVHLDQLWPVVGTLLIGGVPCGQVEHLFFDLDRNLRVGLEVEVPHRVLIGTALRRGHDHPIAVAQKIKRADSRLPRLTARRGQQGNRDLLKGAAQSFTAAAAIKKGGDSGHPLEESVSEHRIHVTGAFFLGHDNDPRFAE